MKRLTPLLLLASISPALTGCLPMMAVSAASMAAHGGQGKPTSDEDLQAEAKARDACTEQAAKYGSVQVNVVQQPRVDRIIVWGTVDTGKEELSFQCDYGTKITGFTLRHITPAL